MVVSEGVRPLGVPSGPRTDWGCSCLYVLTGMTFPSAPVSILHSRGIVLWPTSTPICIRAWVSASRMLSMYREWKYSCGVSGTCVALFGAVGNSVSGSVASKVCIPCCCLYWLSLGCIWPVLVFGRERQTDFQWPSLPQLSHLVPYAGHDLLGGSWNVPQLPHLASWVPCVCGLFMLGTLCLGFRPYCFRASIVVVWLPLISCNWLLVASCVRAMLTALLRVKVESYSRSFDWTRGCSNRKSEHQ